MVYHTNPPDAGPKYPYPYPDTLPVFSHELPNNRDSTRDNTTRFRANVPQGLADAELADAERKYEKEREEERVTMAGGVRGVRGWGSGGRGWGGWSVLSLMDAVRNGADVARKGLLLVIAAALVWKMGMVVMGL